MGWQTGGEVVDIVMDLEDTYPVAGVRIHTSARQASKAFLPKSVIVAVSDNGRTFRVVKKKEGISDVTKAGYDIFFTALHTAGRYTMVRIEPREGSFVHADEITVFDGDYAVSDAKHGGKTVTFHAGE